MISILDEIRQTIVPDPGSKDGPLPPLLLALTLVTGFVDAFSYLALGHIFVANMTGNVVFLGFALAGAPSFSIGSSLIALVAFAAGALLGGLLGAWLGQHRGKLLSAAAGIQAIFLAGCFVLATLSGSPVAPGYRYPLIAVMAIAMGIQSATSRKLAVSDLTTNVLTMTLTGIAADSVAAGSKVSTATRRLMSVAAMLIGGVIGAVFVFHRHVDFPVGIALVLTVVVAVAAWRLGSGNPSWVFVPSKD